MMPNGAAEMEWGPRAQLAWDSIALKRTRGVPARGMNVMDIPLLEDMTGHEPGDYARDPEGVYLAFQKRAGACAIDQFIPRNPLTMGQDGFQAGADRGATTGAESVILDGLEIDSPEAVVEHMEEVLFPRRRRQIEEFEPDDPGRIENLISSEREVQRLFGPNLLKGPYSGGFQDFPHFHYTTYGYQNYFMAYALYPEVMERDFAQQADLARLRNRAAARAITEGGLPPVVRLDHDMADSRGTLVDVRSLDRIWFPHFARAVAPFLAAGVRLLWHCDGNLMEMVPRLIEAGVGGFQGFQYEAGMDYPRICRMTDRDGGPLLIYAGVSVTRTLPFGTPSDVRDELRWLVENGPPVGLFLGVSSSVTPGTPHANIRALIEGLHHYREHGRTTP
ncbi:MAG: hypothetical protein R6X33_19470 [Candidatus Brocadiia bacterium]